MALDLVCFKGFDVFENDRNLQYAQFRFFILFRVKIRVKTGFLRRKDPLKPYFSRGLGCGAGGIRTHGTLPYT